MYEIGYHDDDLLDGQSEVDELIGLPKHLRKKTASLPLHLQKRAAKKKRGFSRMHNIPITIRVPDGLEVDGNARWWIRDDELFASVKVTDLYSGATLNIATNVPFAPIREWVERSLASGMVDVGWNPFKSIADAGRWVGKTVSNIAKSKVVSNLTGIVNNPVFKNILGKAASFIPGGTIAMNIAGKAMGLVNKAKAGGQQALNKISNINKMAGQNPQIAQLWQFMSNYFRQPQTVVPQMQQMMQQRQQNPYGMMPRFQMPMMQRFQQPTQFRMPMQYGYGMPMMMGKDPEMEDYGGIDVLPEGQEISGWLYNRPFRSNTEVFMDAVKGKFTPGMLARGAYHKGVTDTGGAKGESYYDKGLG